MRAILLLLAFSGGAFGAITNLKQVGATSTSVLISYTKYSPSSTCRVRASKVSNFATLASDTDVALYAGADSDNRYGNAQVASRVTAVVGKHGAAAIEKALDGYSRSRALQAFTPYYVNVDNCGDGDSQTIVAWTANIPLGITRGYSLPVDPDQPFTYKRVSANTVRVPEYADPFTGVPIVRTPAVRGFGYGATSNTTEALVIAGCNIAMSPMKGACRFVEATGTGWTATSGTTTDAILADDNNFAEYPGTAQQKLFLRYGGASRFPNSATYGSVLASLNAGLRAKTSDASGEGGWIRSCLTHDGANCAGPPLRVSATATEASYVTCDDSPCSVPDKPGDIMMDQMWSTRPGLARIYNVAGSYTTIRFVGDAASAECSSLGVGQRINSFNSTFDTDNPYRMTVESKNCAASPPQVTVTESFDLTQNSTNGTTYWREEDIYNFGLLVWKESTTSAATISIDLALLRSTFSMDYRLAAGAGGFGRTCAPVAAADGYFPCMGGYDGNIIFGVKPQADGSLAIKNYGFGKWRGNQLSANLLNNGDTRPLDSVANYPMWDQTLPGVFYVLERWSGGVANGKVVLVQVTLDLTEKAVTDIDSTVDPIFNSPRAPRAGISAVSILTPCDSPCDAVSQDHTLSKQYDDVFGSKWTDQNSDFPSCSAQAVQGKDLYIKCLNGGQDSYAFEIVLDLGNKLPVGAGFVGTHSNTVQAYAGTYLHDTPSCRWCADHTVQSPAHPGGSPFIVVEATNKCQLQVTGSALTACVSHPSIGTCSACPAGTVIDGYDYSGKPMCSNITISSTWNPAWTFDGIVQQPPLFESGDPVDAVCGEAPSLFWLMKIKVGDFISHTQSGEGLEYLRFAKRTNNQDWWVIRGWGAVRDSSSYQAKNHSAGSTWQTKCGSILKDPLTSAPVHGYALAWFPALSPDAQNESYAYLNQNQNHGVNGMGWGVKVEDRFLLSTWDFSSPSAGLAPTVYYSPIASLFAGKTGFCSGNSCETHPTLGQVAATGQDAEYFSDVHPRLFGGTSSNDKNDWPLVAGKNYIRKYTPSGNADAVISAKHFDVEGYMGVYPLRMVDSLTDSYADNAKDCYSPAADGCFSGSLANSFYRINESFDRYFSSGNRITCRQTQFALWMGDGCLTEALPNSASTNQYRLPKGALGNDTRNGRLGRTLMKSLSYRETATENVKNDPSGKTLLGRGFFYLAPPPLPLPDGVNRATWQAITQTRTAPAGTSTAIVRFGYDPDFRCSRNRGEACIANSASIGQTDPFYFASEAPAGLACTSSCTITIPAISGVMYSRWEFRDAGGNVIHVDPIAIVGVH